MSKVTSHSHPNALLIVEQHICHSFGVIEVLVVKSRSHFTAFEYIDEFANFPRLYSKFKEDIAYELWFAIRF